MPDCKPSSCRSHIKGTASAWVKRFTLMQEKSGTALQNWETIDDDLHQPTKRQRHDSPDASPPRRQRHGSPDALPPRRKRHDSPDASPPRRQRHDSPDASPPRRQRHGSLDASPLNGNLTSNQIDSPSEGTASRLDKIPDRLQFSRPSESKRESAIMSDGTVAGEKNV